MKPISIAFVLGLAAALTSFPSHADGPRKGTGAKSRVDTGMQAIAVRKKVGQPGYGWRYFADAREGRAVVISPKGDYYYSEGEGLKLVFKATGTA